MSSLSPISIFEITNFVASFPLIDYNLVASQKIYGVRKLSGSLPGNQRTANRNYFSPELQRDLSLITDTDAQALMNRIGHLIEPILLALPTNPAFYEGVALLTERIYPSHSTLVGDQLQSFQQLFRNSHMDTGENLEVLLEKHPANYTNSPTSQISLERFFHELNDKAIENCLNEDHVAAVIGLYNSLSYLDDGYNPLVLRLENHLSKCIAFAFKAPELPTEFLAYLDVLANSLMEPIRVDLTSSPINDSELALLARLPIKELILASCKNLTRDALVPFRDNPFLFSLDISCNPWVDQHVLMGLPRFLGKLIIALCSNLRGAALPALSQYPLESLDLWGLRSIYDANLAALPCTLKELKLRGLALIGKETLRILNIRTPNLEKLDLRDCSGFHGDDLTSLLLNLVSLSLWNWRDLKDDHLVAISGMSRLKKLYLEDCPHITAKGLAWVPAGLDYLRVGGHRHIRFNPSKSS